MFNIDKKKSNLFWGLNNDWVFKNGKLKLSLMAVETDRTESVSPTFRSPHCRIPYVEKWNEDHRLHLKRIKSKWLIKKKKTPTWRRISFAWIANALSFALTSPHGVFETEIWLIRARTFVVQGSPFLVQYHLVHFDKYSMFRLAGEVRDPLNSTIVFTYRATKNHVIVSLACD